MLRIETSAGIEGVGSCFAGKKAGAQLVGKDPLFFFKPGVGMVSPLDRGDAPLWNLVGPVFGRPVWRLFGGYGPPRVTVCDGSIYFADILPEFETRGVARILEEVDHALAPGIAPSRSRSAGSRRAERRLLDLPWAVGRPNRQ